jgi:2-methylcitrate dehydratase PrpD
MITDKVAHFIAEIKPDDIPEEAFEYARMAVTDFCGVALAGSYQEIGNIIAGCIQDMGGKAESGVIGKGFKTTPHLAALANGTMGHALDYDDLSFVYGAHPSVDLVPVVLSIGESIGASGREILTAYIVGFEACARISSPIANSHYMQGWHSTGNIGVLGSTAAAARLLRLNIQQIKMAYGIVVSAASGIRYNNGTMTKPFHAGNAASSGVLSCLLAKRGFTSREDAIEAPSGYAKVFGCNDVIDWEKTAAGLGKVFSITKPGIGFKPYPSCGGTLGVSDAALYLRRIYHIEPSSIREVILGVGPFENRTLIHDAKKGLEGKFSMEYCVSRMLLDGKIGLNNFTDEQVNQPAIKELSSRTKCVECYPMAVMGADASGLNPQSVTIKMADGREYFRETPIIGGMPVTPMTPEEIENKFKDCALPVLDNMATEKALEMLRNLSQLGNVRQLMAVLTAEK